MVYRAAGCFCGLNTIRPPPIQISPRRRIEFAPRLTARSLSGARKFSEMGTVTPESHHPPVSSPTNPSAPVRVRSFGTGEKPPCWPSRLPVGGPGHVREGRLNGLPALSNRPPTHRYNKLKSAVHLECSTDISSATSECSVGRFTFSLAWAFVCRRNKRPSRPYVLLIRLRPLMKETAAACSPAHPSPEIELPEDKLIYECPGPRNEVPGSVHDMVSRMVPRLEIPPPVIDGTGSPLPDCCRVLLSTLPLFLPVGSGHRRSRGRARHLVTRALPASPG